MRPAVRARNRLPVLIRTLNEDSLAHVERIDRIHPDRLRRRQQIGEREDVVAFIRLPLPVTGAIQVRRMPARLWLEPGSELEIFVKPVSDHCWSVSDVHNDEPRHVPGSGDVSVPVMILDSEPHRRPAPEPSLVWRQRIKGKPLLGLVDRIRHAGNIVRTQTDFRRQ